MSNQTLIHVLAAFIFLSPAAQSYASVESEKSIVVQTQPKAFEPSIQLKNVSGIFTNVTGVKIRLSNEAGTELNLQDLGNKTWEVKLTPEQIKSLLGNKKTEKYSAELVIQSKNEKGRAEYKKEKIQIVINGDGSASTSADL